MNDFAHIDIPGIKIDEPLGVGGMARVFLASQIQFDRRVAVKIVSPPSPDDAHLRERFLAEARINAQLTHANIVQVYDFGTTGADLYLVMEYLPGGDLTSRLRGGIQLEGLLKVIEDISRYGRKDERWSFGLDVEKRLAKKWFLTLHSDWKRNRADTLEADPSGDETGYRDYDVGVELSLRL